MNETFSTSMTPSYSHRHLFILKRLVIASIIKVKLINNVTPKQLLLSLNVNRFYLIHCRQFELFNDRISAVKWISPCVWASILIFFRLGSHVHVRKARYNPKYANFRSLLDIHGEAHKNSIFKGYLDFRYSPMKFF